MVTADVLKGIRTGVEHYTQEVIGTLHRCDDVKVCALVLDDRQDRCLDPSVPRQARSVGGRFSLVNPWFCRPPGIGQFDVVHCPTVRVPFWPPSVRGRIERNRPAYVITVPDLVPLVAPRLHKAHYRAYYRLVLPRLLRRFDGIVAISRSTADDLRRFVPGVADRVRVVYPGTRWTPIDKGEVKPKGDYLLAVGTLEPRKNIAALVDAFLAVKRAHPGLPGRLLIAGKPGWGRVARGQKDYSSSGDVEWLGYVDDDRLRGLYEEAKALVYPSLYEGFGLPVIEAMALGCPVITSDRSSLPEAGGMAATYVDPTDAGAIRRAIKQALLDSNDGDPRIAGGLKHASGFSWERCGQELVDFYRDLVRAKTGT